MKSRTISTIFLTLLLVLKVNRELLSQNSTEDFKKINMSYLNHKQLSSDVEYILFEDEFTDEPMQVEKGEFMKDGDNYYSKIGSLEIINRPGYFFSINHKEKTIYLTNNSRKNFDPALFAMNLEKTIAVCSEIKFKELNKTQNQYVLVYPSQEYKKVEIVYNKKTFMIEKIVFYYFAPLPPSEIDKPQSDKPPRLELACKNINLNPAIPQNKINYYSFLTEEKGKITPLEMYKDYSFYNYYKPK